MLYFLLFHPSKEYLKECLEKIKVFLSKEKLSLNKKSRIYKNTNHFIFLGRTASGKYGKYRSLKRKLKYKKYLYENGKISLPSYLSCFIGYKFIRKKVVID